MLGSRGQGGDWRGGGEGVAALLDCCSQNGKIYIGDRIIIGT